jgi:hypothetical protein
MLSILGLIIQKAHLKDFVYKGITDLFNGTDHHSDEERLGCSRGLGQAAATHTDPVLTKLSTITKAQVKSGGWFSKPSPNDVTTQSQATALLAYGYVCMLTPLGLITSRVEVHIVNNILPVLTKSKAHEIKENGLRAIDLIGKAVHPRRLKDFVLKPRDDLVKCILETINPQKLDKSVNIHRLRVLGLDSISTLV